MILEGRNPLECVAVHRHGFTPSWLYTVIHILFKNY